MNIVEAELKMEVSDDIRAASMTANMIPLRPESDHFLGLAPKFSISKKVVFLLTMR